jgi:Flp pilus assembly protein TadB
MSSRTFAFVMVAGLAATVVLLALGAALNVPGLEYAGFAAVVVVLVSRLVWGFAARHRSPR